MRFTKLSKSFLITALTLAGITFGSLINKVPGDEGQILGDPTQAYIPDKAYFAYNPADESFSAQAVAYDHLGDIKTVWDKYQGKGMRIGIIDSGIDYDHPEFFDEDGNSIIDLNNSCAYFHVTGTSSTGYTIKNDGTGTCTRFNASSNGYTINGSFRKGKEIISHTINNASTHGTNVAGTIASYSHYYSKTGTIGVAPKAELVIFKVDNYNDSMGYAFQQIYNINSDSNPNNDIDVVNISMTTPAKDYYNNMETYSTQLANLGVPVVAAAGNDKTSTVAYPAALSNVIGVGALEDNSSTVLASYSNFNNKDHTVEYTNDNSFLVAPGQVYTPEPTSTYKKTHGTSFASPIVAASCALWKEKNPTGTVSQLRTALKNSCTPLPSGTAPSWNYQFGYGRLEIDKFIGTSDITKVTNLTLDKTVTTIGVNEKLQLAPTISPSNASCHEVQYWSMNESVAKVDHNGLVTALKSGTAQIYAKSLSNQDAKDSFILTVSSSIVPVSGLNITKPTEAEFELTEGDTYQCAASVLPSNATNQKIDYIIEKAEPSDCISLSESGLITALKEGCAMIQISANGNHDYNEFFIITINPASGDVKTTTLSPSDFGSYDDKDFSKDNISLHRTQVMNLTSETPNSIQFKKTDGKLYNTKSLGKIKNITVTENSKSVLNNLGVSFGSTQSEAASATKTLFSTALSVDGNDKPYFYISNGSNAAKVAGISITYEVMATKEVTKIELSGTAKSEYFDDETFDPTGLTVTATYSDGTTLDVTSDTIWPTSRLTTSQTKVTGEYTYNNKKVTVDYSVSVTHVAITSIVIAGDATKKAYFEGDSFSSSGLIVTANYNNGAQVDVTNSVTWSPNPLTAGITKVTATYQGKTADYSGISVTAVQLTSIGFTGTPKKNYYEGQSFDKTGLTFTAHYNNSHSKSVTNISFTPSTFSLSDTKVTCSYTENEITKSVEITGITVTPIQISSISIVKMPTKTTYFVGEEFNSSGLEIAATNNDGSSAGDVTNECSLSNVDMTTAGQKTITVTYHAGITTSFNINVKNYSISIDQTKNVKQNTTAVISATNADNVNVTWTANNDNILLSNKTNTSVTITGLKIGTSIVTATVGTEGYKQSSSCTVTISEAGSGTLLITNISDLQDGDEVIIGMPSGETDIPSKVGTSINNNWIYLSDFDGLEEYITFTVEIVSGNVYLKSGSNHLYSSAEKKIELSSSNKSPITLSDNCIKIGNNYLVFNNTGLRPYNSISTYGISCLYLLGGTPTPTKTLESIAVVNPKVSYNSGDTFVQPVVNAIYSDGTTKQITASFSGYNLSNIGAQTVNVSYTEKGITKTTSYNIFVTGSSSDTYTLVSNVSDISVGDVIVIAAKDSDYALGTTQNKNNRNAVSITKSGSNLGINDNVQLITLEEGTKTGTYAFNVGNGYLSSSSSSSNNLVTNASKSDAASWSISISQNVASITAQGSFTRNIIKKNSSSALFSCYGSGQDNVSIYKKISGGGEQTDLEKAQQYAVKLSGSIVCYNGIQGPTINGTTWENLASEYSNLNTTVKTYFVNAEYTVSGAEVTPIDTDLYVAVAVAKYDQLVTRYSYVNFMGRDLVTYKNPLSNIITNDGSTPHILIVVASTIAVSSVGIYIFVRRKKENY